MLRISHIDHTFAGVPGILLVGCVLIVNALAQIPSQSSGDLARNPNNIPNIAS